MEHDPFSLLKIWLSKEVDTMRDILGNMYLEEQSLIFHDSDKWRHIMQERSRLYNILSIVRIARLQSPQPLPENHADQCEIQLLANQLIALLEKLHDQNSRNGRLVELRSQNKLPQPPPTPQPKKNLKVATITEGEE